MEDLGPAEGGGQPRSCEGAVRPLSFHERIAALFEVFICAGVFSHMVAAIPFSIFGYGAQELFGSSRMIFFFLLLESLILIGLISFFQRLRGERLNDLGFNCARPGRDIAIGLGIIPFLFLINLVVSTLFKLYLPQHYSEENPLLQTIKGGEDLALFLIAAVVAGGIKEELQRAFILLRFERYLYNVYLGLVLWSVAFGAGHLLQGKNAAVSAGLFGLLFGLLFLWRRSILAPVVAHAGYDIAALLAFWFLGSR